MRHRAEERIEEPAEAQPVPSGTAPPPAPPDRSPAESARPDAACERPDDGRGPADAADALADLLAAAANALRRDPVLRAALVRWTNVAAARSSPIGGTASAPAPEAAAESATDPASDRSEPQPGPHETSPPAIDPARPSARRPADDPAPGTAAAPTPSVAESLRIGDEVVTVEVAAHPAAMERSSSRPLPAPSAPPDRPAADAEDPPVEPEPWWSRREWPDLDAVATSTRLVAEAVEFELRRRRDPAGSAGSAAWTTAAGNDPHVDGWVFDGRLAAADREVLESAVAACRLTSRGAALVRDLEASGPHQHDLRPSAYQAFASAQYLMRHRLHALDIERDPAQEQAYLWLRKQTDRERIYIERHLRDIDEGGAPAPDSIAADFDALEGELHFRTTTLRTQRKKLDNLQYKCRRLTEHDLPDEEIDAEWARIAALVETLVASGLPPTHRVMRDAVLDALPTLPDAPIVGRAFAITLASACDLAARTDLENDPVVADGDAAPPTSRAAIDDVLERHPDRIVLALNQRSDPEYPYERPREVQRAFEWLATDYHDCRTGVRPANHLELARALRERCNWHYRTSQSETTVGQFADWYHCTSAGRSFAVVEHIGRGDAKRQGPRSIRVAFAWDPDRSLVVVGFLGQHQRTRAS